MGIGFLAPLFILGLAALIVPILVHLIQRHRKEVVRFPSLMFLEKVPYRSMRRQTIRHWTLFLIRSAAVALLALAFARPLLEGTALPGASDRGPREVVVLLDASYSMAASDRFAQAKDAAREILGDLRPEDRASLVQFDEDARIVRRSESDPEVLLRSLDDIELGSEGTRFGPALRLAQTVLETTDQPVLETHLISDFQERAWRSQEDLALPSGTEVFPVPISGPEPINVAVANVAFRRDSRQDRSRVTATARIVNLGPEPVSSLDVQLSVADRTLQTTTVDLQPMGEAGAATAVEFDPFTVSQADTRGRVTVEPDGLPADDTFHFVLSPESGISVLIVEPRQRRRDASLYLLRALEIGDAPGFRTRVVREDRLTAADLERSSVVVFNGSTLPSALSASLGDHVDAGGGVLVVLDEGSRWSGAAAELLPGTFGPPLNRAGGALGWVDADHPAFEALGSGGEFAGARFFRYRRVEPDSAVDVLARFDDGSPALVERRTAGRIMMWATGVDNFWNDLALQPVYLPFVHATLAYLAGVDGGEPWHLVGTSVDIASLWDGEVGRALDGGEAWVLSGPVGEPVPIRRAGTEGAFVRLNDQGFVEIRPARSGATGRWLAVNADRAESNLATIDPTEVTAAIAATASAAPQNGTESDRLREEQRERRQSLWWFLMAAVFALLMLDTAIGNRLSRAPA